MAEVIAISGCSSSGKTTVARLLRDLFPFSFILHEDDFYKEEEALPMSHGFRDWDCLEAINVESMKNALSHVRSTGTFPPTVDSKEDQNSVGKNPTTPAGLLACQKRASEWLSSPAGQKFVASGRRVCFFDGFLLFTPGLASLEPEMDLKLFLRVSRDRAVQRRQNRDGYVTMEGFWVDPPGYVENVVWPNYVDTHQWLFQDGDVEGTIDETVALAHGIQVKPEGDMDGTLSWALERIIAHLESLV